MQGSIQEAITKAKEGNQEAATELYNLTHRMVYFTSLKIIGNEDVAKDLVQDTYIKVFANMPNLRDEEAFIAWVKTIAVNLSKDYLKKSRPALFRAQDDEDRILLGIPETNEDFLPEDYADKREKSRLVMEIIDSLPEAQRMAVILFYYDGLPVADVSRIMETSEGTTKSRLNYARKYIKEKVEGLEREGTKLYGVPVLLLSRILHNASLDYALPQGLSSQIIDNSLRAAGATHTAKTETNAAGSDKQPSGSADSAAKSAMRKRIDYQKWVATYMALSIPLKIAAIASIIALAVLIRNLAGLGFSAIENVGEALFSFATASEDSAIEVDRLPGMGRKDVYKLFEKSDVAVVGYFGMSREEAIERMGTTHAGVEGYLGVSKEEAIRLMESGEIAGEIDGIIQSHILYSDETHLVLSDGHVAIANFYADSYSFHGIKVGMAMYEAADILLAIPDMQFLGLNNDMSAMPNASFAIGRKATLVLYYDAGEIINSFSIMP